MRVLHTPLQPQHKESTGGGGAPPGPLVVRDPSPRAGFRKLVSLQGTPNGFLHDFWLIAIGAMSRSL